MGAQAERIWIVYHGGCHYGLGRWKDEPMTLAEAIREANNCRRVVGGEPFIETADDRLPTAQEWIEAYEALGLRS